MLSKKKASYWWTINSLHIIMFYQIKYSSERVLMLGSRELLTALILAFLTSIICECIYGAYLKRKKVKYEKKIERLKTIEK